jgi:hypothetical protein
MYDYALQCGVPMLPKWRPRNEADFAITAELRETYDCYLKTVGSFSTLGQAINKHMELYYAWRFRAIRRKAEGDATEAALMQVYDSKYRHHAAVLEKEVGGLAIKENVANVSWNGLMTARSMKENAADGDVVDKVFSVSDADVQQAREKYENSHNERLKAKARKDAVPDMKKFLAALSMYDRQLLADVQAIRAVLRDFSGEVRARRRGDLRPHYRALLEAYENEFEAGNGLKDEKIITFFNNYVHDSLAGFAKDATLPSDPRVVYLGGDEKYRYASAGEQNLLTGGEVRMA